MAAVLDGLEAVSEVHGSDPAISALQAELPAAITNAKFDRGELTLTIARDLIREAALVVQKSGYNFLEDVTCVDWAPAEPRFQVTYHILSHSLKKRVRLIVLVGSNEAEVASIVTVWPSANFYEREVFDLFGVRFGGHPDLRRNHDAGRVGRPSAAQGLPGGGLQIVAFSAIPGSHSTG